MAIRQRPEAAAIESLDARLALAGSLDTAAVRRVRRSLSRELSTASATTVLVIADTLTTRDRPFDQFIAAELLSSHAAAMDAIGIRDVRRLGRKMDSWSAVDVFACYLSGPLWRLGRIRDAEVHRWARSNDRWWRRAAGVSTVPLNNRARGGTGDVARTLAVCRLVIGDRDPMVVKALSWALRELAKRHPDDVRSFLAVEGDALPALVRREVTTKLQTGRKSPGRRSGAR